MPCISPVMPRSTWFGLLARVCLLFPPPTLRSPLQVDGPEHLLDSAGRARPPVVGWRAQRENSNLRSEVA
eukprot:5571456-Alexandrium_andersonii.AAC.1